MLAHLETLYLPYKVSIQWNLENSKSWGLEVLFRIINSSNYREVDIKHITQKQIIFIFFLSNISFGHLKETCQGDVSFTYPKHMLLKTVIRIVHE